MTQAIVGEMGGDGDERRVGRMGYERGWGWDGRVAGLELGEGGERGGMRMLMEEGGRLEKGGLKLKCFRPKSNVGNKATTDET